MLNPVLFVLVPVAIAASAAANENPYRLVDKQVVLQEFAQCVFEQAPQRSRAFLATPIETAEEESAAQTLFTGQFPCIKERPHLSMQTGAARGALAEAVLKSDQALSRQLAALQPVDTARPTETDGRKFVYAYAQCLTAKAPAQARELIGTEPASTAERQAMMAFDQALSDCMPTGLSYQINIRDVRNHVATALYDRAIAASGGGDTNA
jgi:hypothetical protein